MNVSFEALLGLLYSVKVVLFGVERDVFLFAKVTCLCQICVFFHFINVDEGRRLWEPQVVSQLLNVFPY